MPDNDNDFDEPEYVEFRGQRWFVTDVRWDESGLPNGIGSHWHLTLTGPVAAPSTTLVEGD